MPLGRRRERLALREARHGSAVASGSISKAMALAAGRLNYTEGITVTEGEHP